jgi:hypothetical protein
MRSDRKLQLFVALLSLALQVISASMEATTPSGRAYYSCNMMSGKWTDIQEGVTFTCPAKKDHRQPSGGLHCESECTFLVITPTGKSEKRTIRSPSGMSRGFTFIKPGDKIKIIKIK